MYESKPEYRRFVALAGVDEHILEVSNGSNVAKYPSVVFKVFIDGREAASSPVMRISEQPWRFDVPIPEGSRTISLVATDAGDGNREDLANWVDAGFIISK
jgi:beta-galactosidase